MAASVAASGSSGYSSASGLTGPTPVSFASCAYEYMYGSSDSLSLRYLRLMEVYGSPWRKGCLSLAAHPSIVIIAGRKDFHSRSRVYVWGLPPKMPSTSLVV